MFYIWLPSRWKRVFYAQVEVSFVGVGLNFVILITSLIFTIFC